MIIMARYLLKKYFKLINPHSHSPLFIHLRFHLFLLGEEVIQ